MLKNVQLVAVRPISMMAWMSEHPGTNVDEIATHFHYIRRQVRRDIEHLAPAEDSLSGAPFELDWEFYEQEQHASLRSMLGASAPLRLSTLEAWTFLIGLSAITPLLGMNLAAYVPHTALAVCVLGDLGKADAEQRVEAIPSLTPSSESLGTLRDALLRGECVFFIYVSAFDVHTRRIVDPWPLEASASGWLPRG